MALFDRNRAAEGEEILGSDVGTRALSVSVVENGILKTFLMSRSPIEGFPHSNGHGRRQSF